MNKLEKICEVKRQQLQKIKNINKYKNLEKIKLRGFLSNLKKVDSNKFPIIAEIKKKSPSKGILCKNFDPLSIAKTYEKAGAKCLSILTEEKFFGGDINFIPLIKEKVSLPVLRKDFIIDEWQIYESYYYGADCILLILAILNDKQVTLFYNIAKKMGMDVICEVHDDIELKRAIKLEVECIGINNRNLKTLEINIENFQSLVKKIPKNIFKICESGIKKKSDLHFLSLIGAQAFLIGETLMKSENIYDKTLEMVNKR